MAVNAQKEEKENVKMKLDQQIASFLENMEKHEFLEVTQDVKKMAQELGVDGKDKSSKKVDDKKVGEERKSNRSRSSDEGGEKEGKEHNMFGEAKPLALMLANASVSSGDNRRNSFGDIKPILSTRNSVAHRRNASDRLQ